MKTITDINTQNRHNEYENKIEAIWRAITWDDVILLGFRKDCSEMCIVSATDKDAIDDLANNLAEWFKKQSAKKSTKQV